MVDREFELIGIDYSSSESFLVLLAWLDNELVKAIMSPSGMQITQDSLITFTKNYKLMQEQFNELLQKGDSSES